MKSQRNGKIELLRFVFSITVVLYHCQKYYLVVDKESLHLAFFSRGYIGVEFFFLVAGFLMAKSIYKKNQLNTEYDLGVETIQFTWRKIKGILPWHFVSFFILFLGISFLENYSVKKMILKLLDTLPNLFLFSKAGFNYGNLNRVEWYISCMIFAMMILYPMCRKYYSMFVHVIAPVGGLFLLGYITENYGTFTGASEHNGVMFICMIRAIAEIALGATAYEVSRELNEKELSEFQRKFLTLIEITGWTFVMVYVMSTMYTKYEIYAVIAMLIAIPLSFSKQTYGNAIFNNKFCYFLGKASLPIYLSQVLPLDYVNDYLLQYGGWEKTVIMLALTLISAVVCALVVRGGYTIGRYTSKKIKDIQK